MAKLTMNGATQVRALALALRDTQGYARRPSTEGGPVMYKFLEYSVEQYMTHPVKTVTQQMSLRELEALFAKHDFNAFSVMEGTTMVGLVTKFDFLKTFAFTTRQMVPQYDELMQLTVDEVMTEVIVQVAPADPLTRTLQLMSNLKARSFPVVAPDGHPVGMIAREDIMRALKDATRAK
jgi:CBS-domain-containing membrane protein